MLYRRIIQITADQRADLLNLVQHGIAVHILAGGCSARALVVDQIA